jgi:hypothetical protein
MTCLHAPSTNPLPMDGPDASRPAEPRYSARRSKYRAPSSSADRFAADRTPARGPEMFLHPGRPARQQRLTALVYPGPGLGRPVAVQHLGTARQVFRPVVDVQQPLRPGQLPARLVPDPLRPVAQDRPRCETVNSQKPGSRPRSAATCYASGVSAISQTPLTKNINMHSSASKASRPGSSNVMSASTFSCSI